MLAFWQVGERPFEGLKIWIVDIEFWMTFYRIIPLRNYPISFITMKKHNRTYSKNTVLKPLCFRIPPESKERFQTLAKKEYVSGAHYMTLLIDREYKRRFKDEWIKETGSKGSWANQRDSWANSEMQEKMKTILNDFPRSEAATEAYNIRQALTGTISNRPDGQSTKKTSKKHRPSGAIFASLLFSLTILTWQGGFGLPAWVGLIFTILFFGGVVRAIGDYKMIFLR